MPSYNWLLSFSKHLLDNTVSRSKFQYFSQFSSCEPQIPTFCLQLTFAATHFNCYCITHPENSSICGQRPVKWKNSEFKIFSLPNSFPPLPLTTDSSCGSNDVSELGNTCSGACLYCHIIDQTILIVGLTVQGNSCMVCICNLSHINHFKNG
jgi:hypothetical protein